MEKLTAQNREFILKELGYLRSQCHQEVRELQKPNIDWRMRSLAQNNLESAQFAISRYRETLKRGVW